MGDQHVQSGKQNTFKVSGTTLTVRLELDPSEANTQDDRYTLYTSDDDSVYSRTLSVKDDCEAGDPFVTLCFEELPSDHDYSLKIEPGGGADAYHLFEGVPLDELLSEDFALEGSGAAEDEDDSAERPDGMEEALPPTEDVVSWDAEEEDEDDSDQDDEDDSDEDDESDDQEDEDDSDATEPDDEDEDVEQEEEPEEEEEEPEDEEEPEEEEDEPGNEEEVDEEEEEPEEDGEDEENEEDREDEEIDDGR